MVKFKESLTSKCFIANNFPYHVILNFFFILPIPVIQKTGFYTEIYVNNIENFR